MRFLLICFVLFSLAMFQSCGLYRFNMNTLVGETMSIDYFSNHAKTVQPSLSQQFTDALKDKFLSQTKLTMIEENADVQISGKIIGYTISPTTIQGETATYNRLTISVKVNYFNKLEEKRNFERTFTAYKDYPSEDVLTSDAEEGYIAEINTQLVDDIYRAIAENW